MKSQKKCFVCENPVSTESYDLNTEVNMAVCNVCKGTSKEKEKAEEMLNSLADGLICGCI